MKRVLLIGLVLLFMVQASIKTVILINWKIYQQEITEQYCINKNKPEMQCNGQCYLAKKMRAISNEYEASKSSYPPVNVKDFEVQLFFQQSAIVWHIEHHFSDNKRHHFREINLKTASFHLQHLQPPETFMNNDQSV